MMNVLPIFGMHEQWGPYALKYYKMMLCLSHNCRCDGECVYKPKLLPSQKKDVIYGKTLGMGKLARN
jgi:hypothetical protein